MYLSAEIAKQNLSLIDPVISLIDSKIDHYGSDHREKLETLKNELISKKTSLVSVLSVITEFLLADDDPQLLAQWKDTQSSLPQALVSTNPEDYTEDQYACHAYLIKTDANTYSLAFTTQKGVVEIRTEQQEKTRDVQKTRTQYYPFYRWVSSWWSWFRVFAGWFSYEETYWETETYTESVEVQTVVSQDCDHRAEVDTLTNMLSTGNSHTFVLNSTTSLTGSIMVDDHRRDPLGYRIVDVTSNNPITINSQPVELSTLDDNPSNGRWVRLDSISVY